MGCARGPAGHQRLIRERSCPRHRPPATRPREGRPTSLRSDLQRPGATGGRGEEIIAAEWPTPPRPGWPDSRSRPRPARNRQRIQFGRGTDPDLPAPRSIARTRWFMGLIAVEGVLGGQAPRGASGAVGGSLCGVRCGRSRGPSAGRGRTACRNPLALVVLLHARLVSVSGERTKLPPRLRRGPVSWLRVGPTCPIPTWDMR